MDVQTITAAAILTEQRGGFLAASEGAFTHTLAAYTGCQFGNTSCGLYCYAQFLPNWTYHKKGMAWGQAVAVKENAPDLLARTLRDMRPEKRRGLRIFMSSSTDPYQPLEATWQVTRRCLEVFAAYPDLDLLVIQTRSPLVQRDFDLIRRIPYGWLSMTIETDDPAIFKALGGGPLVGKRLETVRRAVQCAIPVQVAVSPCLPHTPAFAGTLLGLGAQRVVVDTCVDGDGSQGRRTARSRYAAIPHWDDTAPAHALYAHLAAAGMPVGWSAAGFCGIPSQSDVNIVMCAR